MVDIGIPVIHCSGFIEANAGKIKIVCNVGTNTVRSSGAYNLVLIPVQYHTEYTYLLKLLKTFCACLPINLFCTQFHCQAKRD